MARQKQKIRRKNERELKNQPAHSCDFSRELAGAPGTPGAYLKQVKHYNAPQEKRRD